MQFIYSPTVVYLFVSLTKKVLYLQLAFSNIFAHLGMRYLCALKCLPCGNRHACTFVCVVPVTRMSGGHTDCKEVPRALAHTLLVFLTAVNLLGLVLSSTFDLLVIIQLQARTKRAHSCWANSKETDGQGDPRGGCKRPNRFP